MNMWDYIRKNRAVDYKTLIKKFPDEFTTYKTKKGEIKRLNHTPPGIYRVYVRPNHAEPKDPVFKKKSLYCFLFHKKCHKLKNWHKYHKRYNIYSVGLRDFTNWVNSQGLCLTQDMRIVRLEK